MLLRDNIRTAIGGITVNKTRSALTMLGIIIGVGSVVLMVSMGGSFQNYGLRLAEGRLLDQTDEDGARSVAVISAQTAIDLFGDVDPLGRKISIGGFSFTIVGLLQSQGSLLLQDLDKPVYIPFT